MVEYFAAVLMCLSLACLGFADSRAANNADETQTIGFAPLGVSAVFGSRVSWFATHFEY